MILSMAGFISPVAYWEAKLGKDEQLLAKTLNNPRSVQWYIDHLKARIAFDKRCIEACRAKADNQET